MEKKATKNGNNLLIHWSLRIPQSIIACNLMVNNKMKKSFTTANVTKRAPRERRRRRGSGLTREETPKMVSSVI